MTGVSSSEESQNPAYSGTVFFFNMDYKKIIEFFEKDLWRISEGDVSPFRFLWLEVLKKVVLAIRFFTAKRVLQKAAALTYSTLLAIVPIMAVVFAIARGFGYSRFIEVWFRQAFESQPQAAEVIIGFVNSYLVHTKSGVFLGIGLFFMKSGRSPSPAAFSAPLPTIWRCSSCSPSSLWSLPVFPSLWPR